MNKQPKVLQLADKLQHQVEFGSYNWNNVETLMADATAELRRLHAENVELLEALTWIDRRCPTAMLDHPLHSIHKEMAHDAGACARAAIAKATTGETK